jgi:hypothetical protein
MSRVFLGTRRETIVVRLLTVVVISIEISASAAYGGVVAPSRPSQVVTLFQSGSSCPTAGIAIDRIAMSDGTTTSFVIPPNQVLVLSGFEWQASGLPGNGVTAILSTQAASTVTSYATSTATLDSSGVAFKNDITPMIVIKPGRTICISVTSGSIASAFVHGFLAPDR